MSSIAGAGALSALKACLWLVLILLVMTDNVVSAPANTPEEGSSSQVQVPIQDDSTAIKNSANVPEEPQVTSEGDFNQYKLRPDSLDLSGQNKKSPEKLEFHFEEENSSDLQLSEKKNDQ